MGLFWNIYVYFGEDWDSLLKDYIELEKLELQLVPWSNSSHILLAQGYVLLVLVNIFVCALSHWPSKALKRAARKSTCCCTVSSSNWANHTEKKAEKFNDYTLPP